MNSHNMSINATVDGQTYQGINKIQTGGKNVDLTEVYSGIKEITENGTHDVSGYQSASVNVPQGSTEAVLYVEQTLTDEQKKNS